MAGFKAGFSKGDEVVIENPRYVVVSNGGKEYTVGDNGERRERLIKNGSLKHGKALKGNLSLDDIKN